MRAYLAALASSFGILFLAAWAFIRFDYGAIALPDYQIIKAHQDLIASCDLGDFDFIGDSTANADIIPSRIGPGVRVFGLGGGTPVETFYLVQSMLKCPDRPKAIGLQFVPSAFGDDPAFPAPERTYFWQKSYEYHVVTYRDAIDLLKRSKAFGDPLYSGAPSLFDIDFRLKAALYAIGFPPYFMPDFEDYLSNLRHGMMVANAATDTELYDRTIADNGHHFYGMHPYGLVNDKATLDHDANRVDDGISPLADFYMRRTIALLNRNGIEVFLIEPPRQATSAALYPPGLAAIYEAYLRQLQASEADAHLLGAGFQIWDAVLFGDESHLNLRGSLIFSAQLRDALAAAGVPVVYGSTALRPQNLYAGAASAPDSADGAVFPALAYPAGFSAGRVAAPGLRREPVNLVAHAVYAISVTVENVNADGVALQVHWRGGVDGAVGWNFAQRRVRYSGNAGSLTSGVTLCPGGWVQLFLTGKAGAEPGVYPGPAVSVAGPPGSAVIVYDVSLERGLWPANYCRLQAGESN